MDFYVILMDIMKEKQMSIADVAKACGLTDSTVRSMVDRKQKKVALNVAYKLSKGLDVSLERLNGLPEKPRVIPALSEEAMRLARHYESLDDHGRQALRAVADVELERLRVPAADPAPRHKLIPLLGASFAAGKAEPDFGNMWEDFEVSADIPAEFAIRVHGDSMEPALPDGCIAFGVKRVPQDGEVGAFMLNGEYLCKQYCRDSQGNVYLFSLNRARSDLDISLMRGADPAEELYCFGTILTDRRYPLP